MNGNIIGEPIVKSIDDQINHRQQIHGAGYIPGTPNIQRTPEVQNYLKPKLHYTVDEKAKNVTLTGQGIIQIQKILNIDNLYKLEDPWVPYILNAIRAHVLYTREVNYIVKNREIQIVDEFTGRIMANRRWSDGLHQAIEAKEKQPIQKGSETLASITYQNFFLNYPKLAGMTGTARTSEVEFENILI